MKWLSITIFSLLIAAALAVIFKLFPSGLVVSQETIPKAEEAFRSLPQLPNSGAAPELAGIADWINFKSLSLQGLKDRIILVDFWTYSCINCIRTIPHLSEWYKKYKDSGFMVLGVHSPEFDFEKEKANVIGAVRRYQIEYPVALDNDHATWNAFANQYWPAHYLIDASGNIRYRNFGEGHYAETEAAIQELLLEAGKLSLDKITQVVEPPADADYRNIGTPEIYLGYLRINNVGNQATSVHPNVPYKFSEPQSVEDNRFYFVGSWKIGSEAAEFAGDGGGKLLLRYRAGKVNMVLGAAENKTVKIEIRLDREPLAKNNAGKDIIFENGKSLINVVGSRLYNLVDAGMESGWHTLEIRVFWPGLQAFTFTFG